MIGKESFAVKIKITQFLAICCTLLTAPLFGLHAAADETTPVATGTELTTVSTTETTATVTTTTAPDPLAHLTYSANAEGVTIDRYAWLSEDTVSIPAEIDGKPVTKIGENAFQYCYASEIVLPDTVAEIADSAFAGCRYLKQIKIPENCTRIGAKAFAGCTALESAEIPSSIEVIGDSAFDSTPFLTKADGDFLCLGGKFLCAYHGNTANAVIPDGITSILARAFAGHKELTSVVIPASVSCIQNSAFEGCDALETIEVRGTLTDITRSAFESTKWFQSNSEDFLVLGSTLIAYRGSDTEVAIPDGIRIIGGAAFENCSSIAKITISNGVTEICRNAFNGCTALQIAELPNSVKIIGDKAFFGCEALKELYLPDTVTEIGKQAIGYRANSEKSGDIVLYADAAAVKTYASENGIPCQPRPADVTQVTVAVKQPISVRNFLSELLKREYQGAFFGIVIGALLVVIGLLTALLRKK